MKMKRLTALLMMTAFLLAGCSTEPRGEKPQPAKPIFNASSSYFDNYITEQADGGRLIEGTVHQENDGNAIVINILSDEDTIIGVSGTMTKVRGGDARLVYIAPDGTETTIADDSDKSFDTKLHVLSGKGTVAFLGDSAVYQFELRLEQVHGVEYSDTSRDFDPAGSIESSEEASELDSLEDIPGSLNTESLQDAVISRIYGEDFHRAYGMEEIVASTDAESFTCDYKKLEISLEGNCILLAQLNGDGTERSVKYNVNITSGECAIWYDNEEGESVLIWSGTGQAEGTTDITLSNGANCLRLTPLDKNAELELKLQCSEKID